jgi:two-component system, NtrC family, sensor kinase
LTESGPLLLEDVIFTDEHSKSIEMLSIFNSLNLMKEKVDNLFILREKLTVEYVRNANLTSLGVLASGIAHDFNNILQGVYSAHVLIEERMAADEKVTSLLKKANLLTQRGQEIVNGILLFSRNKEAEKEEINLSESLLEVLRLGQLLTFKDFNISLKDNSSSSRVSAVRIQLFQVFTNLIKNACDATDISSSDISITIDNDPESQNVIIKISDNGMGIEKSELTHIFDPFYTTKTVGQGTGLGLSIVHGVISDFHGTITASSELNVGTEFEITLPLING